jgi:putative endonuclease
MNPFGRYFVYILASRKYGPIYVGVTGNLIARTYIHREDILDGFSSRYKTHLLVFYEQHGDPIEAITLEDPLDRGKQSGVAGPLPRSAGIGRQRRFPPSRE